MTQGARPVPEHDPFDEQTLIYLRALVDRYPTIGTALDEISHLSAVLTLPKGTVHVVSDVHGEFKKLKHIINNASGALRAFVEEVFDGRLSSDEQRELLNLVYYPSESYRHLRPTLADATARRDFLRRTITRQFELARVLARRYSAKEVERAFPAEYRMVFRELLHAPFFDRTEPYVNALVDRFVAFDRDLELVRLASRLVRNLTVYELIVAGDLGDRGPRLDKVVDYIMRQPRVAVTWGNHDVTWMAACLGHRASMATVLRVSLRYRRLSQLEEGYGIPLAPLERLARDQYADDPVERFHCRGEGLRDALMMSRMQKAIAIIQFKLEGQIMTSRPELGMADRALLGRVDPESWTVDVDGTRYPLLDTNFPTVDWSDPFALSPEEHACVERLRESFLASPVLWRQMRFVLKRGATYARRDDNLIFHGCVPVDEEGNFLSMEVAGERVAGRKLFDAIDREIQRVFCERDDAGLDLFWYLWTGPLSPLFGKDRMATFETYLVADKATHKETKNPYFRLIHTREFCERVFDDFGVDRERGLIVNGHVPVKIEQGESPVKESGAAVTIDGAFSEAYGDRGYTLVLRAGRTFLAQHHHFESIEEAITAGADIVPTIQEIRTFERPRLVGDTEAGEAVRREIAVLELLIRAYRENRLLEHDATAAPARV